MGVNVVLKQTHQKSGLPVVMTFKSARGCGSVRYSNVTSAQSLNGYFFYLYKELYYHYY